MKNSILHFFSPLFLKWKHREKPDMIPLPPLIEIEPVNTCNLRCIMCNNRFIHGKKPEALDIKLMDKLRPVGNIWVKIGSNFEPLMHPAFPDLLDILGDMGCHIDLITNGTLLTPKLVDRIARPNLANITISFDSIQRNVYERIRHKADFESTLECISYFRNHPLLSDSYFAVNTVLCRSNIDELIQMIDFWNERLFHQIRFIFMVIRYVEKNGSEFNNLLRESLYPVRDLAFSKLDHAAFYLIEKKLPITLSTPYYRSSSLRECYPANFQEHIVKSDNPSARDYFNPGHYFQKGSHPGLTVDCKSPFTFARILFNGEVQLCYKFNIGNLKFGSFEDIWNGKEACQVRNRILSDASVCNHCDYYRFCLNSTMIDVNEKINYFNQELLEVCETLL